MFLKRYFPIFIVVFLLFSCASRKKLVYLQGIENQKSYETNTQYEPTLQPDDLLSIVVSAENSEVAAPFNLPPEDTVTFEQALVLALLLGDLPLQIGHLRQASIAHPQAILQASQQQDQNDEQPVRTAHDRRIIHDKKAACAAFYRFRP